jgi:2-keto-4-pentenoate hydratase/2-oxohepta-3-ene-1,7-dioic acid hydratase in catechol pathway
VTGSRATIRFILRGAPGGGPPTWLLSDGHEYYAPDDGGEYPVEDASAMTRLWGERGQVALHSVETPDPFLTPLPVRRIFCPAVNFRAHSAEAKMEKPSEPYFFLKFPSSAVPHESVVRLPYQSEKADFEGEIGVVVGRTGKHWGRSEAAEAVFGYTISNDLSLRDYQFREQPRYGKNWVMGKQFDGALPLGPWILPREVWPEFRATIRTRVNGEVRQDGSTDDMFFTPPELIAYLSEVNTLGPGDVVTSGTPAGVAAHQDQRYLRAGDQVEIEVGPIGTLRHTMAYEPRP